MVSALAVIAGPSDVLPIQCRPERQWGSVLVFVFVFAVVVMLVVFHEVPAGN